MAGERKAKISAAMAKAYQPEKWLEIIEI